MTASVIKDILQLQTNIIQGSFNVRKYATDCYPVGKRVLIL